MSAGLRILLFGLVGAVVFVAGTLVASTDSEESTAVAVDRPATVRVPLATLRSESLVFTADELVRLEVRLPPDGTARPLQAQLPPWLSPVERPAQLVTNTGVVSNIGDAQPLLAGETPVPTSSQAVVRVDLEVDHDSESGLEGTIEIGIGDQDPQQLTVSVSDRPTNPVADGNRVRPFPDPSDRDHLQPWSEDADSLEQAVMNRWTSAAGTFPFDDQTQFVRFQIAEADPTSRWLTDVHAYPGDRLHAGLWIDNGATATTDDSIVLPEELDDGEPEIDPRLAVNLRVHLIVPALPTRLHHLPGRIAADNTSPRRIGAVGTIATDVPTTLEAHQDAVHWWQINGSLGTGWVSTDPGQAASVPHHRIGSEFMGNRYIVPAFRHGLVVPLTVRADEELGEGLRG